MTAPRQCGDYVRDILDAVRKATAFAAGMSFDKFEGDEKTVYAVVRALEVAGEAAKSVPEEMRQRFPRIPWRDLTGMRDKLIHGYFDVSKEIVWKTVTQDLPGLPALLTKMLRTVEREESA
jgi:uncharacterized protein with HEPN domain